MRWVTMLLLTIWVYIHSLSSCCLPNLRNPAKFSRNPNFQQLKVIDLGASWKRICNFLLVIN